MNDDPLYNQLLEESWRRKLSEAEERQVSGHLAGDPKAQAQWESEAALNEVLCRLPEAPVASNFTAQVLRRLEAENRAGARQSRNGWRFWRKLPWLPRVAFAAFVLGVGLLSYQESRLEHRKALLRSVEVVSEVPTLPSPKVLEDFDAIRALNTTPAADEQLLALMQ
jgi:anti-sigma factor RsiW